MRELLKRLRGAFGNALVWAIGWGGVGGVLMSLWYLLSVNPSASPIQLPVMPFIRLFAGIGFLSGGAFSLYLGVAGRNKRLDELSAIRIGLGGAVAAALVLPIYGVAVFGTPGDFRLWADVLIPSSIAFVLGGATAFSTVKIAQRGDRILAEASLDELEIEQSGVRSLLEE